MATTSRLLIADDHAMFRQGLRALLEDAPDLAVVGEAENGLDAIQKARELRPDIVLMDIQMPVCGGLEALAVLHQELPSVKVIVLTVHGNDADLVYRAVKAGAVGYVPKLSDIEDLVKTIRLVASGQAAIAPKSLTSLVAFLSTAQEGSAESTGPVEKLSGREQEVLELVAQGKSNREIGQTLSISESTVRSHLHNILGKLDLGNRVQAATFALNSIRRDGRVGAGPRGRQQSGKVPNRAAQPSPPRG